MEALAHHSPKHLAYQHHRRLACTAYWGTQALFCWFADQALRAFPPEDGILSLVGDSTRKDRRCLKHPVTQKTRLNQHHPYVLGFRTVT